MGSNYFGLKTDQKLLDKLAATHKPSPAEILEQRVSFAYSSVKPNSGVTREQVRQVLLEQSGGVTGAEK
jgi:hypothetical protein